MVLFLVDTGRLPQMGFKPQKKSWVEAVNRFVERMKEATEEAKATLQKAKDDMALYYNRKRVPAPEFKPGDKVFVDARDLKTTCPSKKFDYRFIGPYTVEQKIGSSAYRVKLPPSMNRVHPVFHVIKLKEAPKDPIIRRPVNPLLDLEIVDGEPRYEVEEILDS